MKTKLSLLSTIALLSLAAPAFGQHRAVTTTVGGRTVVTNHCFRPGWRGCGWGWRGWGWGPTWSVGVSVPFYGGYWGGYPYYGGYYPYSGYYPSGSYGYGYGGGGYYNQGSSYGGYSNQTSPYYGSAPADARGYGGSVVARVQQRLARDGYYAGAVDGLMGPQTRSAVRAYERRHGLPVDGVIDRQLLATMGLA